MSASFAQRSKNIDQLIQKVSHFSEVEGEHESIISGLSFHSRISPTESTPCIYNLGLGLVLQGQKDIIIGDKVYQCRQGYSMLTTIDLPVTSHVVEASLKKPFLALLLLLDLKMVNEVVADLPVKELPPYSDHTHESFSVESADIALIDAVFRLVKLID